MVLAYTAYLLIVTGGKSGFLLSSKLEIICRQHPKFRAKIPICNLHFEGGKYRKDAVPSRFQPGKLSKSVFLINQLCQCCSSALIYRQLSRFLIFQNLFTFPRDQLFIKVKVNEGLSSILALVFHPHRHNIEYYTVLKQIITQILSYRHNYWPLDK